MDVKHFSISNYSDIKKISSEVDTIHLRKFVSQRMIDEILKRNPKIRLISFSRSAIKRCNPIIVEKLKMNKVEVIVKNRGPGRPNLLEAII
ncbi:MAG: hypothetical protein QXY45_01700 [Candidatus Aenigmatarchaeota archaeon]